MKSLKKYAMFFSMGLLAIPVVIFAIKVARHMNCNGSDSCPDKSMYEKVGKGIDEKLKESMVALDKATAQVQSVFEHIKDKKA